MKIKKVVGSFALLLATVFLFASCEVSGSVNDNGGSVDSTGSSVIEEPATSGIDKPSVESKGESTKEDLIYNMENINFSYADNLVVKEIEGVPYFYYNETSFFYAESVSMDVGGEDIDETFVAMFFDSAKESFSQGSWKNGEIANAPQMGQFNGLNVWVAEISMEREGVPYISSTALVYHDGILTNLTLIADAVSYQTNVTEFAKTIASISPRA